MNALLILGIAHVIGDYLLQWRKLAENKEKSGKALLLHGSLYAAAMGLAFLCGPWQRALLTWGILAVSHGIIDWLRVKADNRWNSPRARVISFCADQALHLSIIVVCWVFLLRGQRTAWLSALAARSWFRPALLHTALLCVIWQPTAILVRKVLAMLPPPEEPKKNPEESSVDAAEAGQGEVPTKDEKPPEPEKAITLEEDFRSGELIGKLERVIVAALVLSGADGKERGPVQADGGSELRRTLSCRHAAQRGCRPGGGASGQAFLIGAAEMSE